MLYGNIYCGDTSPSSSVHRPDHSQSNPNEPNPKLAGLSKNGVHIERMLKKNLKKGFIRELQSKAGYLILFTLKKDGGLRPYIDY